MSEQKRRQLQRTRLEEELDLLSQKLHHLRMSRGIQTDPSVIFKLNYDIKETQERYDQVMQDIEELDKEATSNATQPTNQPSTSQGSSASSGSTISTPAPSSATPAESISQHPQKPVEVFCAAAHEDRMWLAEWEKHLRPLQQAGRITFWSEMHLLGGSPRDEQIQKHLTRAQIIILLISPDFFASDECNALMEQALQYNQQRQSIVVPLLLRPSSWGDTPLSKLPYLPGDARPIMLWTDRDEAFQDCIDGVRKLLYQVATFIPTSQQSQPGLSTPMSSDSSVSYYSCFISSNHRDEVLARRLHTDLINRGVHCWLDSHDMKIGDKIRPAIERAINSQEKLLLILSQHSIKSDWVGSEVEAAFEKERLSGKGALVLFPIRLDDTILTTTESWAADIRRTRHIGDFTSWTDPQEYQRAFERLLRDLKRS